MKKIVCVRAWLLLGIGSVSISVLAQNSAPSANAALETKFEVSETINIKSLGSLRSFLQSTTPLIYNHEVIQKEPLHNPTYKVLGAQSAISVSPGIYTASQILDKAKARIEGLSWSERNGFITIIVARRKDIINPFEQKLNLSGKLTVSPQQLIDWASKHSGKAQITSGIDFRGLSERSDRVSLHVKKGMRLRDVFNLFCQKARLSWGAEIFKRPTGDFAVADASGKVIANSKIPPGVEARVTFTPLGLKLPKPKE